MGGGGGRGSGPFGKLQVAVGFIRNRGMDPTHARTSDGGNGNHSVSLPIILIKIKVDQMLPSSCISSLLVCILHSISYFHKSTALFWGLNGHFLYYTYRK